LSIPGMIILYQPLLNCANALKRLPVADLQIGNKSDGDLR